MPVSTRQTELALAPRQPRAGQWLLTAFMVGVTWLAVLGAVMSTSILRGNETSSGRRPVRANAPGVVYEMNEEAPTSFGSITGSALDLVNSDGATEVSFSITLANNQNVDVQAPEVEDFKVVNNRGEEGVYLGGNWTSEPVLRAQSSTSADLRFAAPLEGGILSLEYRERNADQPIRIALGYATERPGRSAREAGAVSEVTP